MVPFDLGVAPFVGRVTQITVTTNPPAYPLSSRLAGMIPSPKQKGNAMTDLNREVCELTTDELDNVSGGINPVPNTIGITVMNALFDKKFRDLNIHIYTGPLP
jgi:bacteriocin-like protein